MRWSSLLVFLAAVAGAGAARGADCSVTVGALDFGRLDPSAGRNADADGRITVRCDAGTRFSIRLGPGLHSGGVFAARKLRSPSGRGHLRFNLFLDSARTRIWGDGTDASETVTGSGTAMPRVFVVHGRIPGRQEVPEEGLYSDHIRVTVSW